MLNYSKYTGAFVANICITGANRGIGLALSKCFAQSSTIYALCRKSSEALSLLDKTTVIEGFDINNNADRESALNALPSIDTLILNAGILHREQDSISSLETSIQQQIQTNAISPLIFAKMASNKLNKGAKIILISSRMGSIEDNLSGGLDGYRMSKSALNAGGCNLAHELYDRAVSVFIVHPGYIKTDMTHHSGRNTPEEAAENIYQLTHKLTFENTGQFWHADGHQLPW